MQIFYTPDISGIEYFLNEEESKHAIRVLRMKTNDEIYMVDGKGTFFKAIIADPHPKKCRIIVQETIPDFERRPYSLHIGISPLKNPDRFEWFLEKATEIGIDEITPILCEHSEKKNINPERCNRIIESAMKQSIKAKHPILNRLVKINEFVSAGLLGTRLIATCEGEREFIRNIYVPRNDVVILIGPEGDFSETEVTSAKINGFVPVSLGSNRLRTETAGVVATDTISILNL